MKTAEEYLKEKGIHPNEPIFWYSGTEYLTLANAMDEYAKLYANYKLDEAAEQATCEDVSSDNYGGYSTNWQVDKQSILSLKDLLK